MAASRLPGWVVVRGVWGLRVIYLSGKVHPGIIGRQDLGVMLTPTCKSGRPDLSRTPWAADTGCFANPQSYSDAGYLRWLDGLRRYHHTCLFATAPDVIGNAEATLEIAQPMFRRIGEMVRVALVAQDGLESLPVPWEQFDCLFIGGTTAWKLSEAAWGLVAEAKRRGKWAHQGRCNSARRLIASALHGCDSADGTYLAFGPDTNWPKVQRWLRQLKAQPALWEHTA